MTRKLLIAWLKLNGYYNITEINGVICGLYDYFTTCGLVVDLSTDTYERRYCYATKEEAITALMDWDGLDHPSGNWIKVKGRMNGLPIDDINPNLGEPNGNRY